mmetsp:Transcript_42653/g.101274  ORF Transcript_42653/g.101274 Transcript_42653/m.101274 type:complete len:403 (-) Transcript_42653:149-1357(-)
MVASGAVSGALDGPRAGSGARSLRGAGSRPGLRAAGKAVARVPPPVDVPRDEAQHPPVLVRVVVHVDHDGVLRGVLLAARDEPRAARAEKGLGIDELEDVHHPHRDLRAAEAPVGRQPDLLVEHLLVPGGPAAEPLLHAVHEGDGPLVGTQVRAPDVEGEDLQVEAAAAPTHRRVVDAPEAAVGPRLCEAVRLRLEVRVAVEVAEGVLQEDEVHVRDEDPIAEPEDLPHEPVLEGRDLVRRVAPLEGLKGAKRRAEELRLPLLLPQVTLCLVVEHGDGVVGDAGVAEGAEPAAEDVAAVPPADGCVPADHHAVRQGKHYLAVYRHTPQELGHGRVGAFSGGRWRQHYRSRAAAVGGGPGARGRWQSARGALVPPMEEQLRAQPLFSSGPVPFLDLLQQKVPS